MMAVAATPLTATMAGCEQPDAACSTRPLTQVVLYDKAELLGEWLLELEVIDDPSGRLAPGPLGAPERVWVPVPEEDFLYVRSREADAPRIVFWIAAHIDAYCVGGERYLRAPDESGLDWWQRPFVRVDWSTDRWGGHPALASDEERERLAIEPVPRFFLGDEPYDRLPRFERDEAGELTGISLVLGYLVMDRACADCQPEELLVRFTLTRPPT
jgi:hypothetical protein